MTDKNWSDKFDEEFVTKMYNATTGKNDIEVVAKPFGDGVIEWRKEAIKSFIQSTVIPQVREEIRREERKMLKNILQEGFEPELEKAIFEALADNQLINKGE